LAKFGGPILFLLGFASQGIFSASPDPDLLGMARREQQLFHHQNQSKLMIPGDFEKLAKRYRPQSGATFEIESYWMPERLLNLAVSELEIPLNFVIFLSWGLSLGVASFDFSCIR